MRLVKLVLCPLVALGLLACSPTFNWREVRVTDSALTALLPCKPDQAVRPVVMGDAKVDMHMQGCETGQTMFAVAYVDGPVPAPPGQDAVSLLGRWQAANLAALRATASDSAETRVAGVTAPAPHKVSAVGQKPDSRRVESQAVYFSQGARLYYAVILAERISPEAAEAFFTGLKLR
jgi:hypothetical protein